MMKKTCFTLLAVMALQGAAFGQIKGSTMGGLLTVVPDGPFDVARNPALLIFSKQNKSVGVYGRSRIYEGHDTSFEASMEIGQKDPRNTLLGANVSAVFPAGKRILGFSFTDAGGDLYKRSVNELEFSSGPDAQREKSTETSFGPAVGAALCVLLTDHSAVGFQLFAGYTRVDKKTTKEYFQPAGTLMDRITIDQELTRTVGCSPGFGYIYQSGDSQVGLMVKGGSFTFVSERLEYTYRIPAGSSDSREYPYTFVYNGNISINAGAYQRLNKTLGVAFEGSYSLQNSYSQQDLKLKEDFLAHTASIERTKSTNSTRPGVALKAGADIAISSSFSLTAGGAYFYNESQSYLKNHFGQTFGSLSIYLATAGAHYRVHDNVFLTLALNGIYLDGEYNLNDTGLSLMVEDRVFLVDAGVGCVMKF